VKKKSVYLKRKPNGDPLENEKSSYIASICDEEVSGPPALELIPEGMVLVAIVDNGGFEAALVCDNEHDHSRVTKNWVRGEDPRPQRFFIVKRDWAKQMTDDPFISDSEGGE
jgi:hypothetical protein